MRRAAVLLTAVALAPGSAVAQPGTAAVVARPPDPLAVKCKGRLRQGCRAASHVALGRELPALAVDPEPEPTETLAQALQAAYETAPNLQAQRYQLRASDEDYAQALAELRPTTAIQVTGSYDKTVPGRVTQATRFGATSPIITSNTLAAEAILTQPLYTGGKAKADREGALAEIRAGREQLRGTEGDTLLQVITSYADVRRDAAELRLLSANVKQLQATLDEVKARREAGELTKTDIAQAETQFELAETQANTTRQQLEQDRATYAAFVGHDPGVLAPPPPLPHVPGSIDAAFALADEASPDLAQAIATERTSRAKIASAKAEGKPTVTLTGTATLTGQGAPFYFHNDDQEFQGQAVLTIPLTNGGRVGSLVAQAEDKNAADRIGIEGARRQMVDTIINAWNGMATAERNIAVDTAEVTSAQTFDEGTFLEYRAGLRSTFDVLYAHSTLLNAEVALVTARHDLYVAEATLLRRIGMLEARDVLTGTGLYDPDPAMRHAEQRGNTPVDPAIRAIDRMGILGSKAQVTQPRLQQPPLGDDTPAMAAAPASLPDATPATHSPDTPLPGTTGSPVLDRSLKAP